ncbi:hypothetical protein [Cardinium endosymbiont of Oedothorax gibbosus]|nr:hypothetical protein [Cardinium endosymbiont of Oedothorax gibbosus]
MGRNKIRHFSSEEKTKIVFALLKEDLTLLEASIFRECLHSL